MQTHNGQVAAAKLKYFNIAINQMHNSQHIADCILEYTLGFF